MTPLPHRLDRTVTIQAARETVFRFFTDSGRWAAWWGAGSTIEARPGGTVLIRFPNGVEAVGEVVEVRPPERIVFTFGFPSGRPMPAGSSIVTIRLDASGSATRLHLSHEFADLAARDEHIQGWRYQLSVFGNIVADEVNAGAAALVDAWFDAWAEPDASTREQTFERVVARDIRFRDRFSLIDDLENLVAHAGAAQRFMPGVRMHRQGDIRHCQGTALVEWIGVTSGGEERVRGTNVFRFGPDGRIASVTGFMAPRAGVSLAER